MTEPCPNCSKPVLETDTVCWHCGYQLPKRPSARSTSRTGSRSSGAAVEAREPEYDFRALAVYSVLTLVVIFGLFMVMRSLGRQPVLVRSVRIGLESDWMAVTDADLRFTMNLPADWQWTDVSFRDQSTILERALGRQTYINEVWRPLGDRAAEAEILALALQEPLFQDTSPQSFVVVGQSSRMHNVALQDILDLAAEPALPVTEAEIDTRMAGQPQARFTLLDRPNDYQCRHLFVDDALTGYLVAACAPQPEFAAMQRDLGDILNSFQLVVH